MREIESERDEKRGRLPAPKEGRLGDDSDTPLEWKRGRKSEKAINVHVATDKLREFSMCTAPTSWLMRGPVLKKHCKATLRLHARGNLAQDQPAEANGWPSTEESTVRELKSLPVIEASWSLGCFRQVGRHV